jgi:thioredoxin:protein disulfide reductase
LFTTKAVTTLLFLAFLAAGCAKHEASKPQVITTNASEPARIASVDVVKATAREVGVNAGESVDAIVQLNIKNGYHVNANQPSYPYLKATELELSPAAGLSVSYIVYPDQVTKKFAFAEKPLAVYEGEIFLKVRLKADKSVRSGVQNLPAKLRVQACDEQVCYAPGTLDLQIPVNIK